MHSNLRIEDVSTKRRRIARLAERSPELGFTSLNHLIDIDWLREAFRRTRKSGAPGVDGQTAHEYAENLEANLQDLLKRVKSGTYRAPPVRRKHIPKGTGAETRPIGIPTFEDKVLQRAIVMLLEPIYEQDFHDGSYGFRPQRSAHDALDVLWTETMRVGGGWILEVDLRKFFDTLDHSHIRNLVSRRIRDGVVRRLIGKWLKAGVMEDGNVHYPECGSPQGGCISPMLANVYLHYVLDTWFEETVKPQIAGSAKLIRFADDFVIVFSNRNAAFQVMAMLADRFAEYGLTVHPDKTRIVDFRHPYHSGRKREGRPTPDTFDLLGFTHYWGKSRKGNWTVKKQTMSKRLTRTIRSIYQWCRTHRHKPVREQWQKLSQKVRGHYAYCGVTGNGRMLHNFRHEVRRAWRKWLNRRNRKRQMTWAKFERLETRYPLPLPKIYHTGHT
ncbi:MAG: group II intron reverse transcriptase/maturase [Nitrospirae bacterium]|nr:MAG: group II intron reverse transcriptase/maturase [Nitrospirota bacterium]